MFIIVGAATDPNEDFSGESHHHSAVENNIEVCTNVKHFLLTYFYRQ